MCKHIAIFSNIQLTTRENENHFFIQQSFIVPVMYKIGIFYCKARSSAVSSKVFLEYDRIRVWHLRVRSITSRVNFESVWKLVTSTLASFFESNRNRSKLGVLFNLYYIFINKCSYGPKNIQQNDNKYVAIFCYNFILTGRA